jgi:hypothetical protein
MWLQNELLSSKIQWMIELSLDELCFVPHLALFPPLRVLFPQEALC